MDDYSEFDRLCANRFVYAVDHAKNANEQAKQAADLMRGWDGRMKTDSVAAAISVLSRRKLWQMMLTPKLGAQWEDYAWFNSSTAMERILFNRPQHWLPPGYESFDQLLTTAVANALVDQKNVDTGGRDFSTWRWGTFSRVDIQHPIFGGVPYMNRIPGLKELVGPGNLPQSGDGSLTVKAAGKTFGASERMTTDFSDLDASNLNIVMGESGQVFSPYYADQWKAWYGGTSFTLPYSAAKVDAAAVHKLLLRP
jgi:penicillin amidase